MPAAGNLLSPISYVKVIDGIFTSDGILTLLLQVDDAKARYIFPIPLKEIQRRMLPLSDMGTAPLVEVV